jgi:hypothetical protein
MREYTKACLISPLSLVGMPYYTVPLMSSWPETRIFEVGKPAPKIPSEVLANVKMVDFIGYAKNPGTFKRNQTQKWNPSGKDENEPKFRSEQGRERLSKKGAIQNAKMRSLDHLDSSQDEVCLFG